MSPCEPCRLRPSTNSSSLDETRSIAGPLYPEIMPLSRTRQARAARRRKRRLAQNTHDLDPQQWTALLEAWGGCAYCGVTGKPMQRDCVLAISRGGRYTLDNVVPACLPCNTSKCNEEVTAWLRRKRLNESAFLLRYSQIKKALALEFPPPTPVS
jgi:5-methylcytosine-specific restriction endonuclease McrA